MVYSKLICYNFLGSLEIYEHVSYIRYFANKVFGHSFDYFQPTLDLFKDPTTESNDHAPHQVSNTE